jgi:hypothetical protein
VVVKTYDVGALAGSPQEIDALRLMILNNIDAPTWKPNGGDVGTISTFKDKLVVTHNALTQQKIDALLRSLAQRQAPDETKEIVQPHATTAAVKPAR